MAEMGFAIGKANTSVPGEGCGFIPNPKLKLLDQVSEVMRFKHYSIRTEATYRDWIKRFIFFHGKRHPREMGAFEVERAGNRMDWSRTAEKECLEGVLRRGLSRAECRVQSAQCRTAE